MWLGQHFRANVRLDPYHSGALLHCASHRRDNATRQARLKVGARHERTLEAVACTPLIMIEASSSVYPGGMLAIRT